MLYFRVVAIIATAACQSANDRGMSMMELFGGKFVCRTDSSEWLSLWEDELSIEGNREFLKNTISGNFTRVFECNVGVIAAYVRIARLAKGNELKYRSYQMAMIFVYTLRNRQKIPFHQELLWNVSTREIVEGIQRYKVSSIPDLEETIGTPVHSHRIALVSICAYPKEHPLILKDLTPGNRNRYASLHGYEAVTYLEHPMGASSNVCIQHSKLWLIRELLEQDRFDWVMWLDCDSIIVNMQKPIESIVNKYAKSDTDLLITEELLGISSANWIIRNSAWSRKFLSRAFDIAHNELPLFGDQDAIIALAIGSGILDSHIVIVPQNEFNAYDALNAYYMGSPGYTYGDLLVTFPQCKEAYCNELFREAFRASEDPDYFLSSLGGNKNMARIRVFGPQDAIAAMYKKNF